MPTFTSPNPISITIDVLGNTHITASDRTDTTVTVDDDGFIVDYPGLAERI